MIIAWYAKGRQSRLDYPPAPELISIDDRLDIFVISRYVAGETKIPPAPTLVEIDDNMDIFIINPNLPRI